MDRKRLVAISLFAGFVLNCLVACSGGGSGSDVVEITLDNSIIPRGGSSIVRVLFSFSADDVFNDSHHVVLVVRLPSGLVLRSDTSDIKRPIDDREVHPQVTSCANGVTYVRYEFGSGELIDASNPGGDADAELRFTIDAPQQLTGQSIFASAANDNVAFDCTSNFSGQAGAAVEVL